MSDPVATPAMPPPLLELDNVTVMRGGSPALDEVSLCLPQGQNVAILGPNGSGKSTLIKLITRELYPAWRRGRMRILGESTWSVFELRSRLGIVSPNLLNIPEEPITGREVVLSGFFSSVGIWQCHRVTAAMEARVEEVLELLNASGLRDRLITEMSSGEAQRMLIGRALAPAPGCLLLDEPTNSLDVRATRELIATLRRLVAQGTNIVMVTHHLHDIVPEVERVLLLRQGRLFGDGSKREQLRPEKLGELFGVPVHVEERDGFYHHW